MRTKKAGLSRTGLFHDALKARLSGLLRGHIGGDVEDVGIGQFADDVLHLAQRRALAVARLHVGQLADQIIGTASAEARRIFMAAIVIAMTGAAGPELAVVAHSHRTAL